MANPSLSMLPAAVVEGAGAFLFLLVLATDLDLEFDLGRLGGTGGDGTEEELSRDDRRRSAMLELKDGEVILEEYDSRER